VIRQQSLNSAIAPKLSKTACIHSWSGQIRSGRADHGAPDDIGRRSLANEVHGDLGHSKSGASRPRDHGSPAAMNQVRRSRSTKPASSSACLVCRKRMNGHT
jgi:hypothetical protein